jgi:PhnB protein
MPHGSRIFNGTNTFLHLKNYAMTEISTYLTFKDNCEEAFNFYKSVFGGDFQTIMRFGDSPAEYQGAESERKKIMHVALPIGQKTILLGSDSPEHMGPVNQGNNVSIAIHPDTREEADRLFNGLSAGGTVAMPMSDAFWGAYFGMFTDKFGIHWMVNFETGHQR